MISRFDMIDRLLRNRVSPDQNEKKKLKILEKSFENRLTKLNRYDIITELCDVT
jgi:hypothetical protein